MRTNLLTAITSATSTLTQFAVSQELPFTSAGDPLFTKNVKKIYVDNPQLEQSTVIYTFEKNNLDLNVYTYAVYFTVDAKNPPSQTQQVLQRILDCKNKTGRTSYDDESDYTMEFQEDKLIYSIEIRSNVATT
jgi:hypothetical protein